MTKKLVISNILILLLICCAMIGYFYANNYPMQFTLLYGPREYDFNFAGIVLLVTALFSGLASVFNYKNFSFLNKFLASFCLLNSIFLVFMISQSISRYIEQREGYLSLEKEYINQARLDMKQDAVTFKYAGGLTLAGCNGNIEHKIDSITQKYGVTYVNTGCVFMEQLSRAEDKYAETVKPYLEKRNGKNWEQKMDKEIETIKKDCN